MTKDVKDLMRCVVNNNFNMAKKYAEVILRNSNTAKDKDFVFDLLKRLEESQELDSIKNSLRNSLPFVDIIDCSELDWRRFYTTYAMQAYFDKIDEDYNNGEFLRSLGIESQCTYIFRGKSGVGKTEFAKYIAYSLNLPMVYVRVSMILRSYLGETPRNIAKLFDVVRNNKCLLLLDEIDALTTRRGTGDDVGEMNRIVISVIQELDSVSNNSIIIGTTNRQDMIDEAVLRRFKRKFYFDSIDTEAGLFVQNFFDGIDFDVPKEDVERLGDELSEEPHTLAELNNECIEYLLAYKKSIG